jgi:microcystin degradation protein MlrC
MNVVASNTSTVKRVAIASFEFEGNDFSPKVCGREQFGFHAVGDAIWPLIEGCPLAVTGGVDALQAHGDIEFVPILVSHGGQGGSVEPGFYRNTVALIVDRLRTLGPFDGIYLALHGAMVSAGVPDAEGALLTQIRTMVGPQVVIAASLDLHAHVTRTMVAAANIIVGYANYPHDDAYETGQRAGALLGDALRGALVPVMRMSRLNMVSPVPGSSTRVADAPLAKIRAFARSLERDGVMSTSYFTVQPWLDDDEAGNVGMAIAHRDAALAADAAVKITDMMWSLRDEFELPLLTADAAIARVLSAAVKTAILADTADCVGAGSSGDSSYVLAALLRHAPAHACAVSLVDPVVVSQATSLGVGAKARFAVGFHLDPRYGSPLEIDAEVISLHNGQFIYDAGPVSGAQGRMGPTAVLGVGKTRILVASNGTYEYGDDQFRAVGIHLDEYDILVLKNGMNFRNVLREGGVWALVDSVGASSANLAALPWKNRPHAFWPRDREDVAPYSPEPAE